MIPPEPAPALDDEAIARLCKALGHPARVAIVRALAESSCRCREIVAGLPLAQSTVSQHLKILREAGLLHGGVEGPRACYELDRTALGRLSEALSALVTAGCCEGTSRQPAEDAAEI